MIGVSPYHSVDTTPVGPSPFFDCDSEAAEPHIRSPLIAAGTKIPHTRGRRARKGGTNLYRGILQPGRYALRPPRSDKGQLPARMAGYSLTAPSCVSPLSKPNPPTLPRPSQTDRS